MPYTGRNWDDVDPTMVGPYSYDFQTRLPTGDSIASAIWALEVVPDQNSQGTDPTPNNRLSGTTNTGTITSSFVSNLLAGVRYKLIASITSVAGVKDDLWSYIRCNTAP